MDKKSARLRRARKARLKIARCHIARMSVHRTNSHIYVQIFSERDGHVLASASTLEKSVRAQMKSGHTVSAAAVIGQRIAQKAQSAGVMKVAFDRSGFLYHGRVKALAEAAREHGMIF